MSEKLQKILAEAGLGSRREIERWIAAGRIKINEMTAKLGDRADEKSQIEIDGKPFKILTKKFTLPVVLMYHKPIGELCTRHDAKERPTVFTNLPNPPFGRWVMVGRLDFNTAGLLLFTNNGELANQLMHPSFHLVRTYSVRIYGDVSETLLARLKKGVMLEDGQANFQTLRKIRGENKTGVSQSRNSHKNHWYEVSVSMGRNRIVRRLWESQGIKVNRLIRIGFGNLVLPSSLKAGEYQLLTKYEIESLKKLTRQ